MSKLTKLTSIEIKGNNVGYIRSEKLEAHVTRTRNKPLSKRKRIRKKQLRKEINNFLDKVIMNEIGEAK